MLSMFNDLMFQAPFTLALARVNCNNACLSGIKKPPLNSKFVGYKHCFDLYFLGDKNPKKMQPDCWSYSQLYYSQL